jgi:hypothetical protein
MQERAQPVVGRVEKGIGHTPDSAIRGSKIGDKYAGHMSSSFSVKMLSINENSKANFLH